MFSACDPEPATCWLGDNDVIDGTGLLLICPPPLPPAPQPGMVRNNEPITSASSAPRRRRHAGIPIRQIPKRGSTAIVFHPVRRFSLEGRRSCPTAAVVIVKAVAPDPVTCAGLKLHVVSAGKPEQTKLPTVPLKAPWSPMSTPIVCDCPWPAIIELEFTPIVKSFTLTEAGLPFV